MEEKVKFIFKWLGIMFILSVITFLIVRFIPVSPVDMLLQHYNLPLTEENRKLLISYYKLDQSLFKQYIVWIKDFLKGNWGISFITKLPVKEEMLRRLPYSLIIGLGSLFISIILSFFLGYLAAIKEKGFFDKMTRTISILTLSIPSFIIAIFIIYYFGVKTHLIKFFIGGKFYGIVFSIMILVLYQVGNLSRIVRDTFVEMKEETFVKFYLIRGFNINYVLLRHCYKPALYSLFSASISKFSSVVGGSAVVEFSFAIPGISYFLISSIVNRDYNVIQAYIFLICIYMFFVHLMFDFLLSFLREKGNK